MDIKKQQEHSSEKGRENLCILKKEWLKSEPEDKFILIEESVFQKSFEDLILERDVTGVDEAMLSIKRLQLGVDKPVKSSYDFLNDACLGGLLPNLIISILARPSMGKTYTAHQLKEDILNSDKNLGVLMYNWEMGFFPLLLTNIKKELNISYKDILYNKPTEAQQKIIDGVSENFKHEDLTIVNKALTPLEFGKVTRKYIENNKEKEQLFIIVDHIGITKGKQKTEAIYELLEECNSIKLEYPNKLTFIMLGQLNREVEKLWQSGKDANPMSFRVKSMHVFGADALQQYSDVMMAQVIPQVVGLEEYAAVNRKYYENLEEHFSENDRGTSDYVRLKGRNRIYFDFIKRRMPDGEPDLHCQVLSEEQEAFNNLVSEKERSNDNYENIDF